MNINSFLSDNNEFFGPSFNLDLTVDSHISTPQSVTHTNTSIPPPIFQLSIDPPPIDFITLPQMPTNYFDSPIQLVEFLNSSDPQKKVLLTYFPKLFAHFFGDSFIKGLLLDDKKLEGIKSNIFLHFLHTFLQKYPINSKFKLIANDLLKAINISIYFEEQIDQLTNIRTEQIQKGKNTNNPTGIEDDIEYSKMREDFAKKITTEISGLDTQPGNNTLLIPGGWTNESSGHTIYCEIIRTSYNYFNLRLFNVGAESQYQTYLTTFEESPQKKIYKSIFPFLELEGLRFDEISSFSAWEIFFEYKVRTKFCPYLNKTNYCVVFLKAIRPNFHIDNSITSSRHHIWKKKQKSGTCTYKSFSAYCLSKLTKQEWRRLKLDIRLYLLEMAHEFFNHALFLSDQNTASTNHSKIFSDTSVLVLRGLKKFAKSVQKDFKNNTFYLSDHELQNILKITENIHNLAERVKDKLRYEPPKINFSKPLVPLEINLSNIFKLEKENKTPSIEEEPEIKQEEVNTSTHIFKSFQIPLIPEYWKKDIQSIHTSLIQFVENAENLKKNSIAAFQFYLENVLNDIPPVDPKGTDPIFWKKLNKTHVPSIMQSITALTENLLGSTNLNENSISRCASFHIYLQQKCLAILHQLYHLTSEEYMGGAVCDLALPFLTHRNDFIRSSKSEYFHISNPSLEKDAEITLDYLLSLEQGTLFTNEKKEVDLIFKLRQKNYYITHELIQEKQVAEINFINQLLNSNRLGEEIRQKLVKAGSKLWNCQAENIEKNWIIALALADLDGSFGIPSIYCSLKRQYIITLVSVTCGIEYDVENPLHNAFSVILEKKEGQLQPNLLFNCPRITSCVSTFEETISNLFRDLAHLTGGELFKSVYHRIFSRNKIITDPFKFSDGDGYRCSYYTEEFGNNQNSFLTSIVPDNYQDEESVNPLMPLDQFRNYVLLGNPDDKSFQVIKTMNYFNKNPLDLMDFECRDFCYSLIFEPGLLTKSLKTIPNMAEYCINFCQNGFNFFNDQLKLPQSLFFLKISYQIDKYFKYLGIDKTIFSGEHFKSPIQIYEKMLERSLLTNIELKLIYVQELICLLETDHFSWETLPLIIRNSIKLNNESESTLNNEMFNENVSSSKNEYISFSYTENDLKLTTQSYLRAWQFIESEFLNYPEKARFNLEKIIRVQFKDCFQNTDFSFDFSELPIIKSISNSFNYDISTGIFNFEGKLFDKLPKNVFSEELVPVNNLKNIVFKSGGYHFTYEERRFIVEMQPSTIYYETLDINGIKAHKLNLSHSYSLFLENKKYRPFYSKQQFFEPLNTFEYSYFFIYKISAVQGWIDESETEIIFFELEKHKPMYKFDLQTKQIINCEPNSFKNGLILGNRDKYSFSFKEFDKFYEIWIDRSNCIQYISFPSFNLNFKLEHGLAISKEIPGYYISDIYHPQLPRLENILVLKNSENEIKVIISKKEMGAWSYNVSGVTKLLQSAKQKYYVYSSLKNHIMFNREVESNLYLCQLFLLNQNYELAWKALKFSYKLFPYTLEEAYFFIYILKFANKYNEPELVAISLHAASILISNKNEYVNNDLSNTIAASRFYQEVLQLYNKYISQIDHVGDFYLTTDQRISLLTSILKNEESKRLKKIIEFEIQFLEKTTTHTSLSHWRDNENCDFPLTFKGETQFDQNFCTDLIEKETTSNSKDPLKVNGYLTITHEFISNNFFKIYKLSQDQDHVKRFQTILMLTHLDNHAQQLNQSIYQFILNHMSIHKPSIDNFKHPSFLEKAIRNRNVQELHSILNKISEEVVTTNNNFPFNSYIPHPIKNLFNHNLKIHRINITKVLPPSYTPQLTFSLYDSLSNQVFLPLIPLKHVLQYLLARNENELINEKASKQQTYEAIQNSILNYNKRISFYLESLNKEMLDEVKKNKFNQVINKEIERYQEEIKFAFTSQESDSHYFNPHKSSDVLSHLNLLNVTCELISKQNIEKMCALKFKRNVPGYELLRMDFEAILKTSSFDFDTLIPLYQSANPNEYLKKFPYLTPNEIREFDQLIEKELIVRTHIQHLQRAKKVLEEISIKYPESILDNPEFQILSRKLIKELTCHRNYAILPNHNSNIQNVSPSQFRTFLIMEYFQDIMLWPEQIASLKILTQSDPQAVVQLKTGSGKSKVFFPILAFTKANGVNLSIIMVLNELMKVDSRDLQLINEKAFGQKANRINWNNITLNGLIHIEKKLKNIIENREFLLVTSNEMHLFMLRYTSLKLNYQKASEKLPASDLDVTTRKLECFTRILAILKNQGDLPIDEIDSALYCRFKFNVPHGNVRWVNPSYHELACFIFENLLSDLTITSKLYFEFSRQHFTSSQPASIDNIDQIKPYFVNKLIEKLIISTEFRKDSCLLTLATYLKSLEPIELEIISNYLLSNPKYNQNELLSVASLPRIIADLLAILKQQIKTLWTVTKDYKVNYGLNKKFGHILAGPFGGANKPRLKSQFGNEIELIFYTIQSYLTDGLSSDIIESGIDKLRNKSIEEASTNRCAPFETSAYKKFQLICDYKQFNLFMISNLEMKKIVKLINEKLETSLTVIREFILPEIKTYSGQIQSNAFMLLNMFKNVQGVTASPWNIDLLKYNFNFHPSKGSDGQALLSIVHNNPDAVYFYKAFSKQSIESQLDEDVEMLTGVESKIATENNIKNCEITSLKQQSFEMLEHFIRFAPLNIHALIDVGALFKNLTNEETAEFILKVQNERNPKKPLQGIVFFTETDDQMIIKLNGTKQNFQKGDLSIGEYFVFFDQKHTTGMDFEFPATAQGIVTFNKNSIFKEILQGAGRLRKLLDGQGTIFMGLKSDADLIKKELHKNNEAPLNKIDLLLYFILKQGKQLSSDNIISIKQIMNAALYKLSKDITRNLLVQQLSLPHIIYLEKLFVTFINESAFLEYGKVEEFEDSQLILNNWKNQILGKLDIFLKKFALYYNDASVEIESSQKYKRIHSEDPQELQHYCNNSSFNRELNRYYIDLRTTLETIIQRFSDYVPEKFEGDSSEVETTLEVEEDQETEFQVQVENCHENTNSRLGLWHFRIKYAPGNSQWKNIELLFNVENYFSELSNANILHANDAYKKNKKFIKIFKEHALFDDGLFLSEKFIHTINVVNTPQELIKRESFFDYYHKNIDVYLVIKTKELNSKFKIVLLSAQESEVLNKFLISDRIRNNSTQNTAIKAHRQYQICLYLNDIGIVQQGADPIDPKELQENLAFNRLVIQTKFINKEIFYNRKEQEILKTWLQNFNCETIETLEKAFVTIALEWDEKAQKNYSTSSLAQTFKTLLKEKGSTYSITRVRRNPTKKNEDEE